MSEPVEPSLRAAAEPTRGWWSKHALNSGLIFGLTMRGVRTLPRGAAYAIGYVGTWMGDPRQERGGKSRRCVKVTRTGLQALRGSRHALDQMWRGLDPRFEKSR